MIRFRMLAAVLATAAILPATAAAQSLPFRAGQWGAEFQSGDLTSAGVMRFMSPRTALVLDAGVLNASTEEEEAGNTVENSMNLMSLRLGFRQFMPIASRVNGFWTAGAQYGTGSQTQDVGAAESERTESNIGVFGQFGANYHVTSNIAVGIAYDVSLVQVSGKERTPGNPDIDVSGHRLLAALTPVRFSIYF